MSYEDFQKRVRAILNGMTGSAPTVNFNRDNGRYYANFSDGTTIVGNSISKRVAVKWGKREAHATI